MDYINIQGDENVIIQELSKYMNQGGAKLIVQNISSFKDVLGDNETFDATIEMKENQDFLAFMIPKTNYYFNVKKTTIALIGLLLDIQFTAGFASFVLSVFGITADTIRKLTDIEKCVLLLLRTDSIIVDNREYALNDDSKCMNFALECTYCQYDKCHLSKEVLNDAVHKLLDKKVVKRNGDSLVYCF